MAALILANGQTGEHCELIYPLETLRRMCQRFVDGDLPGTASASYMADKVRRTHAQEYPE
jgi:hypothetical protein